MINYFLYYTLISIIIISVIHYLYSYFINILTVPKVKDLVTKPNQEYKNIEKIILNNKKTIISDDTTNINDIGNISSDTKNDMKNELKNFFNELNLNNGNSNGNNNGNLSFSSY